MILNRMPRTAIDYSKACIYKICCKDPLITDIYVGSTTDLVRRRYLHKQICINPAVAGHDRPVYQFIRENGGFDNWEVVKIEDYECDCGEDLCKREREVFEELKPTLNKIRPFVAVEERKEHNAVRWKQYRAKNKDHISEYKKRWRESNRERISEYHKGWREANKVECELCGCCVGKCNLKRHQKSKKCMTLAQRK
jgi:hypothetical protein